MNLPNDHPMVRLFDRLQWVCTPMQYAQVSDQLNEAMEWAETMTAPSVSREVPSFGVQLAAKGSHLTPEERRQIEAGG